MSEFGATSTGEPVEELVLDGGELRVALLTLGATLRWLHLDGVDHSLTLGGDRVADYEGPLRYFGSSVGPVANRISNAATTIDGVEYRFEPNQGRHLLHGGSHSTALRVWDVVDRSPSHAVFALDTAHLADRLPGDRRTTARFEIIAARTLRLTFTTTTTAPSIANLTNHSYWNLDGTPTWEGHRLRVMADAYLPTNDETLPTGEVAPVDGTPFDLRTPTRLEHGCVDYDHAFCLARRRRELTEAVELIGSHGLRMTVATTEPGVQIYDAARTARPGRAVREGIAIEPSSWPNACNEPSFPSVTVEPDSPVVQVTEWRFERLEPQKD